MKNNKKTELKTFWKSLKNDNSPKIEVQKYNKPVIINYKSKNKCLIEIKHLCMAYKKKFKKTVKQIFNDLNFNIYDNEITALIGSNGVGKTTIVDIIAQIKKPTNGEVVFHYEHSKTNKIGVQFQDLSFPRGLTVKDMLQFELELNQEIDMNDLDEMLETFRLKELLNTNITKLSGGQQQRLNVIISLMNRPRVVFLDEFTTGLDIAIKNQIKEFIVKYTKKYHISVVLISHDIDIISELVDHFIVIDNKSIVIDTNKKYILNKFKTIPLFLREYIN